jgi:hypothetical protein
MIPLVTLPCSWEPLLLHKPTTGWHPERASSHDSAGGNKPVGFLVTFDFGVAFLFTGKLCIFSDDVWLDASLVISTMVTPCIGPEQSRPNRRHCRQKTAVKSHCIIFQQPGTSHKRWRCYYLHSSFSTLVASFTSPWLSSHGQHGCKRRSSCLF